MIVSITGPRSMTDYKIVCAAVNESKFTITKIISGGAAGTDTLAEIYAKNHSIPFEEFPANWQLYGKRAGHLRNGDIAAVAEAAIIISNGESKGTADYTNKFKATGKPMYLKKVANKKYRNDNGKDY